MHFSAGCDLRPWQQRVFLYKQNVLEMSLALEKKHYFNSFLQFKLTYFGKKERKGGSIRNASSLFHVFFLSSPLIHFPCHNSLRDSAIKKNDSHSHWSNANSAWSNWTWWQFVSEMTDTRLPGEKWSQWDRRFKVKGLKKPCGMYAKQTAVGLSIHLPEAACRALKLTLQTGSLSPASPFVSYIFNLSEAASGPSRHTNLKPKRTNKTVSCHTQTNTHLLNGKLLATSQHIIQ